MNKSYLIAAALVIALAFWLGSAYLGLEPAAAPAPVPAPASPEPMRVQVRTQQAEAVVREITLQGQVEPNRVVTLRAETSGQVNAILAEKGQRVVAGETLLRLAMNDRAARLAQARAALRQREENHEAIRALRRTGYQAQTQLNEAMALMEAARADLERIKLDIDNTAIRAPFAGILNDRLVEFGDYVAVNDPVAVMVDDNPLLVSGQAPQQNIAQVTVGRVATVRLVSGQVARGQIRYVSATADAATRTFRVEVELQNPEGRYTAGVSAEITIPVETVSAHRISPALLSLDEDGALGVKTVDENDRVAFHPVRIVRAETGGIWVSGLPERATLITVGQGFVQPGEPVTPVPAG